MTVALPIRRASGLKRIVDIKHVITGLVDFPTKLAGQPRAQADADHLTPAADAIDKEVLWAVGSRQRPDNARYPSNDTAIESFDRVALRAVRSGPEGCFHLDPRNGRVELMKRTSNEATIRRYHYESHDRLRAHL